MTKISYQSWVVIILGFLLATFVAHNNWEQENYVWEDSFHTEVDREVAYLKGQLETNEQILSSIVSFFNASTFVDKNEFNTFVTPILEKYEFFQAIEWIPKVEKFKRGSFENEIRKFYPNYKIK